MANFILLQKHDKWGIWDRTQGLWRKKPNMTFAEAGKKIDELNKK